MFLPIAVFVAVVDSLIIIGIGLLLFQFALSVTNAVKKVARYLPRYRPSGKAGCAVYG
jgi:hypothetical protein